MSTVEGPSPPESAAWIELPDGRRLIVGDSCRIGRVDGNEIVNPDDRTSRRHAVVQRDGGRFVLVDLGSTNGTFLNDTRIFKPTPLKDGDAILVGTARYTFRLPPEAEADGVAEDAEFRTIAAVGKTSCWMMVVAPSRPATAETESWLNRVRRALEPGGAGLKNLQDGALFVHWREGTTAPGKVRDAVLSITGLPIPPGASVVLHRGAARIGPAPISGEESLLGAEVTFTHKLQGAATELGMSCLLSGPAVESLGLESLVSPLREVPQGVPETHALFTIDSRS